MAWADVPGVIGESSYFATGSGQTIFTGFEPQFVMVKRSTDGSDTVMRPQSLAGNQTLAVPGGWSFPNWDP